VRSHGTWRQDQGHGTPGVGTLCLLFISAEFTFHIMWLGKISRHDDDLDDRLIDTCPSRTCLSIVRLARRLWSWRADPEVDKVALVEFLYSNSASELCDSVLEHLRSPLQHFVDGETLSSYYERLRRDVKLYCFTAFHRMVQGLTALNVHIVCVPTPRACPVTSSTP
jgi:hypothetical protein